MASIRQQFVLDPDEDADIIAWLERQDNKSAAIRAAIRETMQPEERLSKADLRRILREELAKAEVTTAEDAGEDRNGEASPSITEDVDPEAGRRLDEMFSA